MLKNVLKDKEDLPPVDHLLLAHRAKKLREIVINLQQKVKKRYSDLAGMMDKAERIKIGKKFEVFWLRWSHDSIHSYRTCLYAVR
jgi:hypothetical protein